MAGEMEAVVRKLFGLMDRKDFAGMFGIIGKNPQAVDELSRAWMRSREDLEKYFSQLDGAIESIHSELRDVRETSFGDSGIVTCWLEQDYTLQGQQQHVSAPTTAVLHKEDGSWRIVLMHTIPLPEEG